MRQSPRIQGSSVPASLREDLGSDKALAPPVPLRHSARMAAAAEFDVKYVAHLARLNLSATEQQKLGEQLRGILAYVEKLSEVDVSGVEPTAHAVPLTNVVRPDVVQPSLTNTEALRNAPAQANGLFLVPKIVE